MAETLTTGVCVVAGLILALVSLFTAFLGGALAWAASRDALAAGRRLKAGIWAALAVAHGAAWQAGVAGAVLDNWPGWGPRLLLPLMLGGAESFGILAGGHTLFQISRGAGLDAGEAAGEPTEDGAANRGPRR